MSPVAVRRVLARNTEAQAVPGGIPAVQAPDQEEIARIAYELYLQRGRIDGHDVDDWLKAEALLQQQRSRR